MIASRPIVPDASIAVAWLLGEPAPAWVARLFDEAVRSGGDLHVPTHFWLEVGNALVQRRDVRDEQALEGMIRLEALGMATIDLDRPLRLRAVELARRWGLTTYDAAYLALADSLDARIATLDPRLRAAAGELGLVYQGDDDPGHAVREPASSYGSSVDQTSLAALGTLLASLRAEVEVG